MSKPGFHIIVTTVSIAENGCDDPHDHHMETLIFFSVMIVTISIATVVEIETSSISKTETSSISTIVEIK